MPIYGCVCKAGQGIRHSLRWTEKESVGGRAVEKVQATSFLFKQSVFINFNRIHSVLLLK